MSPDSDHGSVSLSATTTATATSCSADSDFHERHNGSSAATTTYVSVRGRRETKHSVGSNESLSQNSNSKKAVRRSSLPTKASTSVTPAQTRSNNVPSHRRQSSSNKLKLLKSEHAGRKSSQQTRYNDERHPKQSCDREEKLSSMLPADKPVRARSRASGSSHDVARSSETGHRDTERQRRRSRSSHGQSQDKQSQDATVKDFGESFTSIMTDHTSSSRLSLEHASRRRSHSRGHRNADPNANRKKSLGRPTARRNSIGRSTPPTATYRAPALYEYEYDLPTKSHPKHDGALERRRRRHSINTSAACATEKSETATDIFDFWDEQAFELAAPVPVASSRKEGTKQRRRASLSGVANVSATVAIPLSAPTKDHPMPKASLFEMMQRVGIVCTRSQVEQLEFLGVTIQSK